MIACPFYFCSCCRWQHSSARRAVSNNPRPGSVRGFFYARSRQAVPGRPGATQRPAQARARPDVRPAPSRPACARSRAPWAFLRRSGHTRRIYRTAHNAPTRHCEQLLYSAYIRQGKHILRVLRPSGVPCDAVHAVPSCRLRECPAEDLPDRPKKDPPGGRPHFGRISERVFDSIFLEVFPARDQPICVP